MLITADKVHNGKEWLPNDTVIDLSDDGEIKYVGKKLTDHHDIKKHNGIICPGFINAHCHLELSHMKGIVPEHIGLVSFLQNVLGKRNDFSEEEKAQARHAAFHSMISNGVVAVGDIANTTDTLDLRIQDKIHFYSFVEAIGFTPTPQKQFDYAMAVLHAFAAQQQESKQKRQSIVPHAPYSVSNALFDLIDKFDKTALLSIHNQETEAEDEYYMTKSGAMQTMLHGMGINDDFFESLGKSSSQTYTQWLSGTHPLILVHNTYTQQEDVVTIKGRFQQAYWCLCPNANLYIENRLPDIAMLASNTENICIGTDSLSSNHQLSVLAELQTIKKNIPDISWKDLLKWGTYNGAKALQMSDQIGSIELGLKPGLIVIDDLDKGDVTKVL